MERKKIIAIVLVLLLVSATIPVAYARYVTGGRRINGAQILSDALDSRHYIADSVDDEHINWGNSTNQINISDLEDSTDNILTESEIDASSELLAIMDDETGTGELVFCDSPTFTDDISINTTGVKLTGDGDGAITFLGLGDGTDESITINLDDTANETTITSTTDITDFNFGTINLMTDLLDLGTNTLDDTHLGYFKGWETSGHEAHMDGEDIYDDTIDDDSLDFADITGVDFTLTDCGAVTLTTGNKLTVGTVQYTLTGADTIDGEVIAADTIDDDSIDFADVTGVDITMTDCAAITSSSTITSSGVFDATGAVAMTIGSIDITSMSFVTDGTTNTEFTFPADVIGDADIDWGAGAGQVSGADITYAEGDMTDSMIISADIKDGTVAVGDLAVPKYGVATSQTILFNDANWVDGGGASAYIDFNTTQIPAGAIPLGWKVVVSTAYQGTTSCIIRVGSTGDDNRFSADETQSIFAAGTVGSSVIAADACDGMNAAQTVRVTATEDTEWGDITQGSMVVSIYYIQT